MDPYLILGAKRSDDEKAIRRRFRQKSLELHPDKGGSAAAFQEVHEAFQLLGDPARRRRFDSKEYDGRQSHGRSRECGDRNEYEWEDEPISEDLDSCAYYLLLFAVYAIAAYSSLLLLGGKTTWTTRLQLCCVLNLVAGAAPAYAWVTTRRAGVTAGERASSLSSAWAQLLLAQVLGAGSGMLTFGVLTAIGHTLSVLINAVGSRTFPMRGGGEVICVFLFCVQKYDEKGEDWSTSHSSV